MSHTRRITSASPYENLFGFCRALRIGDTIHVAGTAPIGPDGKTVGVGDPAARPPAGVAGGVRGGRRRQVSRVRWGEVSPWCIQYSV